MATNQRTFSESWHRVAELHVTLRPAVTIRRQLFRGEIWYVLQDPFNNDFFRLTQAAYDFVIRLSSSRTVAQVWEECLQHNAAAVPGQDEVIQLLAQLHHANLLFCELAIDSQKLFERYRKRQQRENRGKLLSLMFFRIPLFDPQPWLNRYAALARLLTSRFAVALWLLVLLLAGKALIDQMPLLLSETKNLLDFDNWLLLYGGLVIVKSLHEMGHTLVCKRFGGEVHTVGIMFIVFAPMPYMDATASWSFRERRQRILVATSGMLFEFFAAAGAALLWANTGPGAIHSLALNILIVASISTLLFNANPLLRYDGYYILSDLLDIPNLQPRSQAHLKHLARRYFFGLKQSSSPTDSHKEAFWLTGYGILSGIYRLFVYGAIILFVADRFLLAGLLMAVFCLLIWGILPIGRFINYLMTSPELSRVRPRALISSLTGGVLIAALILAVPLPNRFRAPGILEATNHTVVSNQTDGQLLEVLCSNGSQVAKGEPLFRLVNPELFIELQLVTAQRNEVLFLQQQGAVLQGGTTRAALQKRLQVLDNKLTELQQRQQSLLITATQSGTWFAPQQGQRIGSWLPKGVKLGEIISNDTFRFTAIVRQEEAANIFSLQTAEQIIVRLAGIENNEFQVKNYQVIPFEQGRLPSAVLGWKGGGVIPVSGMDAQGLQTIEPFFQISAHLENTGEQLLRHGHSGKIRFQLPAEPLLQQLYRKTRQFLQQRYQT
jgi:putative peptide zinc metalloprotease protein